MDRNVGYRFNYWLVSSFCHYRQAALEAPIVTDVVVAHLSFSPVASRYPPLDTLTSGSAAHLPGNVPGSITVPICT